MKGVLSTLIFLFISLSMLNAQNKKLNYVAYDDSKCGLNFAYGVSPISSRFPTGTGFPGKVSISGIPFSATIIKAYLYTIHSYQTGSSDFVNFRFTNSQSIFKDYFNQNYLEKDIPQCNGEKGTKIYRLDVSNSISGNGTYRISFDNPQTENEVDGICLIIIYQDPNAIYEGHLKIDDGLMVSTNGSVLSDTLQIPIVCNTQMFSKSFALLNDLEVLKGVSHSSTLNNNNIPLLPNLYFQMDMDSLNGVLKNQKEGIFSFKSNDPLNSDCFTLGLTGMYYQTTVCKNCNCDFISDFSFKNVCKNDSLIFNNLATVKKGGPITRYIWDYGDGKIDTLNSSKSISHNYSNPGKYTVNLKVENNNNPPCYDFISKEVEIYDSPIINLGSDKQKAFIKNKNASDKIIWDNDPSLTGDTIYNLQAGFHVAKLSNTNNCFSIDSVEIFAKQDTECTSCCFDKLLIPDAFNPSNEKYNFRNFISADLNCIQVIDFYILDRWGKIQYQSADINKLWEGNSTDGQELSSGIYLLKLNYISRNGINENLIKPFSLIR